MLKNRVLGKEFTKYLLPVINKKCVSFQDFEDKDETLRNMLMREQVVRYGGFKHQTIYGFSYVDEKGKPHVCRFTREEKDFLWSVLNNLELNKNRAKKDWFFRPWKNR